MLEISNNLLILGTGGVGKSMLTRYLFLDTAEYEGYVPVLIELRRYTVGLHSPNIDQTPLRFSLGFLQTCF